MKNTIKEVTQRLAEYNEWRRGGDGEQPNPTQLGHDLDYAVKALNVLQKIASGENWQVGRYLKILEIDLKNIKYKNKSKDNVKDGCSQEYRDGWNDLADEIIDKFIPLIMEDKLHQINHIEMLLEKETKG